MPSYPAADAFAATYDPPSHDRPIDLVDEYERVVQASSEHPDKKSSALSSVVELPRERIRTWVDDDGKPDVVRGLETARENGWIDVDLASDDFQALNTLVAGVFSGGSIDEQYVPAFAPDEQEVLAVRIRDALAQLGAGWQTRADDDPDRATEILPASDGSVLGRVLVALGAPAGAKTESADISLPEYLDDAPDAVREDFLQVYVWNRGTWPSESDVVQVIEARPSAFFAEIGALVEDVTGEPVTVEDDRVTLSVAATRQIRAGRPVD